MDKFCRFEQLVGKEKVSFLSGKSVLIVGLGGVGGYVIEALVRSNIGKVILVDFDTVSLSNCNRQLIAMDSTIGKRKTDVWKRRIQDIHNDCEVIIHSVKLTKENIASIITGDVSYVVDACDDIKAKREIIKYCIQGGIPFLSAMGTGKRLDPSQLEITTLDKTMGDPFARILRKAVKEENIKEKIKVCASKELPKKGEGTTIASCSFVPSSAGLLIASEVVKDLLGSEDNFPSFL